MTRNQHDLVADHFGVLDDAQLADGTPSSGQAPLSNGDGTRTWGDVSAAGGGIAELLTGDSADFTASVGSWTSSSGTVTRDTAYAISGASASLKWAAPNSGTAYVQTPVAGTFVAGTTYVAVAYVSIEETDTNDRDLYVGLGLWGTDSTFNPVTISCTTAFPGVGNAHFYAVQVTWTPTADRTGVALRVTSATALTATVHVGAARVWQTPTPGAHKAFSQISAIPADNGDLHVSPWGNGSGLTLTQSGRPVLENYSSAAGFLTSRPVSEGYVYLWAEHTPGDFSEVGLEVDLGTDYVALFASEKNSTTVQVYSYTDNNIEFAERGTGAVTVRAADNGAARPALGMLPQYASAPPTPVEGQSYYDTVLHKSRTWDGSAWQNWW